MTSFEGQKKALQDKIRDIQQKASASQQQELEQLERQFKQRQGAYAFFKMLETMEANKEFLMQDPHAVAWQTVKERRSWGDVHPSYNEYDVAFEPRNNDKSYGSYAETVGELLLNGRDGYRGPGRKDYNSYWDHELQSIRKTLAPLGMDFFPDMYEAEKQNAAKFSLEELDQLIQDAKAKTPGIAAQYAYDDLKRCAKGNLSKWFAEAAAKPKPVPPKELCKPPEGFNVKRTNIKPKP